MGTPVLVCGRAGRMARLVAAAVRDAADLDFAAHLDLRDGTARDLADRLRAVPGGPPVVVDFTNRAATARLLAAAERTPCALVIGTSGLTGADHALLRRVAEHRAVVQEANFSLALALVRRFVADLAGTLPSGWDAAVVDIHHAAKVDAPSATALALSRAWGEHRGDAPISSLRFGDAVSEHRLLAGGPAEQIDVGHRVNDRSAFVPGVLAAIRFAGRAAPGRHALEEALCG
ncbi:dihydrodipicolinate reductase C-terminal domain-containing protein [Actinoallomurus sp. NPDC050550]|uniref:4-hydroxy-tetrahydrodipicolinate reductase n=1 Tax=Actinoallomurus sp. NPDC050550 TaxID=3154937 RepID=UPI00340428EF